MGRIIVETEDEPYEVTNWSESHRWTADEPVNHGGQDRGPDPYDYLLGSLGSCTAMTVRMYCERKDWPLEKVRVHLEVERVHSEDCEECEDETRKVTDLSLQVKVHGDFTDEQRERVLEIARKCPVRRTLEGRLNISESEVGAPERPD